MPADDESDQLPSGWQSLRLGDQLRLINGFPFKPSQWNKHGLPIIRIQNLNNPDASFNFCTETLPSKFAVNSGDLLFAWSGTPGTSFGAHIWRGGKAWLNQHIFRVEFDAQMFDSTFLRHAINQNLDDYIDRAHGGAGLAHITKGEFENSYLKVPPLPEQRRIAAKIDALLVRVNAARERLAKVPAIMKRFRQAVVSSACDGTLSADFRHRSDAGVDGATLLLRIAGDGASYEQADDDPLVAGQLPDSWVWSRCERLCPKDRDITYGVIKLGPPVDGGVATLRSSNVRWLRLEPDDVKSISPEIAAAYARTFLRGGEVLVTVRGTLGGVAVAPPTMAGFNISREVAMLPVHADLEPRFFALAIGSTFSQRWLAEVTKGVAYSGVNIRDLKRLPLPLPPVSEQQEIVRRVESLFKLADAIEERVKRATTRADRLTQAVLAKAFKAELLERDP
ncbi:MAG: restriction endonuclease subunit S [Planctomycetia bacterium]|nr:restriction endonuclease subunit S [Planctomycetia bacterium]